MARDEDAVLQLLELTLRIKRLRAILMGGSGSSILTDEDRAAIEATLPVLAQEVRRLEIWLQGLPPRP